MAFFPVCRSCSQDESISKKVLTECASVVGALHAYFLHGGEGPDSLEAWVREELRHDD